MEIKKAKSQQQKLQRTNSILDAAEKLFDDNKGELPSAIEIARQAEVAKGTVYLYFPSKEAIFLTLLERHIQKWLQMTDKLVRQYEQMQTPELISYLIQYWLEHKQLGQLYRISDAVLEKNVDDKFFAGYQTRKVNEMKRLVPALQELNSNVTSQQWTEVVQLTLELVGLAWSRTHPYRSGMASSQDFVQLATNLLTPFWTELLNHTPVVEKPKSTWRKLLGS